MAQDWLQLHPRDNLIVALRDLATGTILTVAGQSVHLQQAVRAKHKFTHCSVPAGQPLRMYGVVVGTAVNNLPAGTLITTQNTAHATQSYTGPSPRATWTPPNITRWQHRHFQGYHRGDGQVGTANHWLVIPLVFCENRNIDVLRQALLEPLGYTRPDQLQSLTSQLIQAYRSGADAGAILTSPAPTDQPSESRPRTFPWVDGIQFLTHSGGCGGTRADARALCDLLAGYLCNPNVGGATVLSLGCQNAQITMLREAIARRDPQFGKPLFILEQQGGGTEAQFTERALRQTFAGLVTINATQRQPAPLSKLTLGLECGGSDGFSGISANPALGHAVDLLVALGGRAILAEFPELHGVEQELVNRCVDSATAQTFTRLMHTYAAAAEAAGSGFEHNPSPGNIRDGLITDAMKSAGAARKGGSSPVEAVLEYTAPATAAGLSLLCTPGNDVESTTALAGSGANLIAFTTGLGTPTGNPVAPVVKISSNDALAERMPDLIDFNAGGIITGRQTVAQAGEALLDLLIEVASGRSSTAAQRLGQHDFIPWKRGISL
ncbi:Altronate dehydratase [Neolewinella maritima]|uniref:Altronate dehydratase n=1 Tax=Neolewinella maritima TaxID=1383882 RepID=A0ABN8EZD3_9BACT|nr:altronate dehydratase family protein [Neolewinella maritima]CAH0999212.1 Altronate dehydratase [Neolewinella maritima]